MKLLMSISGSKLILSFCVAIFTTYVIFLISSKFLYTSSSPKEIPIVPEEANIQRINKRDSNCKYKDNEVVADFNNILKKPFTIDQEDERLIQKIRSDYLIPPSKQPYKLAALNTYPSQYQADEVIKIFNGKRNGFFIEAGAFDGEIFSNTLQLEKKYGWEGVLVEPSPEFYMKLLSKNRKAFFVPVCLSPHTYPLEMDLKFNYWATKITKDHKLGDQYVQCLPIFSILLALNKTCVDYFSLDVESMEIDVLNTIPWDKVQIKVISAEIKFYTKIQQENLLEKMFNLGYKILKLPKFINKNIVVDFIFYHPVYMNSDKK